MAFESILSLLNSNTGSLIASSSASFDFDAVTIQQHASKLRLTDNPIESGATITDHAVLDPKEITLNGIMVGYTPPSNLVSSKISSYSLIDYALPIEVKTITAQAENAVNKVSSAFTAVTNQYEQLAADFLPTYASISSDTSSTDRIAKGYEALLAIQRCGETLDVQTQLKTYSNMMIVSISALQQTAMSAEFSIVLREVFIVNTKIGTGLKRNLGVTQPKGVESGSVLSSIFGG